MVSVKSYVLEEDAATEGLKRSNSFKNQTKPLDYLAEGEDMQKNYLSSDDQNDVESSSSSTSSNSSIRLTDDDEDSVSEFQRVDSSKKFVNQVGMKRFTSVIEDFLHLYSNTAINAR